MMTVALPAAAQQITECDKLASHGSDPDKIAPGVSQSAMDKPKAIAACQADVAKDPKNPRLQYQLGRAYFYSGKATEALPHLEAAAGAGHEQAQFVLGYIIDGGIQGVKKDPCRVEDLWVKSARAGRFAAQVSYPHHAMRGKFGTCKLQASKEEIGQFLEATKGAEEASDYYAGLLVSALKEDYAAWAKK
jgi:TPR repeat protein